MFWASSAGRAAVGALAYTIGLEADLDRVLLGSNLLGEPARPDVVQFHLRLVGFYCNTLSNGDANLDRALKHEHSRLLLPD